MENIRIKDIVRVTGGRLLCGDAEKEIRGFSIDSREGEEDRIFVPIIGERVDAHRFIEDALQINGATFTSEHESAAGEKPWIRVEDTVRAMQETAAYWRAQVDIPVVAVTGSVGKTTTREMIAAALASERKVFETAGNQNSQVGVPLTLARLNAADDIAVLEIGMSERGQIAGHSRMIRPDIAVVTVIGVSHIAQLKTQENICREKMDILKGLKPGGTVFLNGDDPFLAAYRGKLSERVFFYGLGADCDYRAKDVMNRDGKTHFIFCWKEGGKEQEREITLGVLGEHNVRNALAALGVCHVSGVSLAAAAEALSSFAGQRQQVIRGKRCIVIDDTYNASPDSMKASVGVLASMEGVTGKRIAALADMLELGDKEKQYHYEVGKYIGKTGIDEVVCFGELSAEILRGIAETTDRIRTRRMESREAMTEYLLSRVKPEDAVLLKGSNGMKLKEVAAALLDAPSAGKPEVS